MKKIPMPVPLWFWIVFPDTAQTIAQEIDVEQLLICNAKIVNEGQVTEGDVLVQDGRIAAIGNGFSAQPSQTQVLDAKGRYLLPGMIDGHVSFCEPGRTLIADIASESFAAIAGGVTSFLDLPDSVNGTSSLDLIDEKRQLALGRSHANFGFYLGASRDNVEQIAALEPDQACAVNVYMGGDDNDSRLLEDPEILEQVFSRSPVPVAAHCEDMPTILENEESYRGIYGDNIPLEFHPVIRSGEACFQSAALALELAERNDTRLHLMHISSAVETELLTDVELVDKRVTAEVGAHFLHFSDEDYSSKEALVKCNPAIKTAEDRASLIQALMDGRLDMVSSGHAPQAWQQKQGKNYFATPSGAPMVQHGLLALLENYHDELFSLEFIAAKTSHAVAEIFNISERGYIREGYWADLVLVDVDQGVMGTRSTSLSRCGWTPFDGFKFRSSIAATIVNGRLVWSEGTFQGIDPAGIGLEYDRG